MTRIRMMGLCLVAALVTSVMVATTASAESYPAFAWGYNATGQLGNGTTTNSDVPVAVSGLTGVTAVAAGGSHSLALLSNGTVMAWGANSDGQLGDGTKTSRGVPVAVKGLSGVTAISAGLAYNLALLSNGTVVSWGANNEGQLGDGTILNSDVPVAVSGVTGATAIGAGGNHSLAVLSNGNLMAWGSNRKGELGIGSPTGPEECKAIPCAMKAVQLSGISGVASVAAGQSHALALLKDGTVMAWGGNSFGELGMGAEYKFESGADRSYKPLAIPGLSGVTGISAGTKYSMAVLRNGTAMAWGKNEWGELGDGNTTVREVPGVVPGLSGVRAVAAGNRTSMALLGNGTVAAWGANEYGQLGNGNTTKSYVPVAVSGLSGVAGISGSIGGFHSLAYYGPPLPNVTSVSPSSGPEAGGTSVEVVGTSFTGASAVKFGSVNATSFTVNSATSITAISPAGTGTVDVTVATPTGTSTISSADEFGYVGLPPTVTSVKPASGLEAGGTSVEVTGTNFGAASAVKFGSVNATKFTVNSATSITAVSPAGTGTVHVTVTTLGGTSATSPADQFGYVGLPSVASVSPSTGPVAGGVSVEITGTNLSGATVVKFGSVAASSFTVNSGTSITAVSPAETAGILNVTVTTPVGTSAISSADHFKVTPTVTGLSVNTGSTAGGTSVTVTGTGFALGTTATTFAFGSAKSTSVNCSSSTTCIVIAPAHAVAKVDVKATVNKATSPTNRPADQFTYN